tara:strand:- start:1212 stop:2873 length:1662 start_codon:yes stop_codon:yes gene_type:complete
VPPAIELSQQERRIVWLKREVHRCKMDFYYFCRTYLKIVDKKNKLISLQPKPSQRELITLLEVKTMIYNLKARKMGSSTAIAAYFFWKGHFTKNLRTLVAAHTMEAAEEIFQIYSNFYENLPVWLKQGPFSLKKDNVRAMKYEHGGGVRVTTASSPSARGGTPHQLHLSEFAHYTNMEVTIGAIMASLPDGCTIVKETTANGLNDAYAAWVADDGTEKVFFPWTKDPDYTTKEKPKRVPPKMRAYAKKHGVSKEQLNWAATAFYERCAGQWKLWDQEFPITAETAFVTSGDKFFSLSFPHCRMTRDNYHDYEGYVEYEKPKPHHIYSLGVDVASGSKNGDYSAFVLLDVTNKKRPTLVASSYTKKPPEAFAIDVHEAAKRFNAMTTIEINGYGLSVVNYMVQKHWPHMYRRTQHNKTTGQTQVYLGFSTNKATRGLILARLHSYIEKRMIDVTCDIRVCSEINQMIYKNGKPQCAEGEFSHDDILMAFAMALEGMSQISKLEEEVKSKRPKTRQEIIQWEMRNCRIFDPSEFDDDFIDTSQAESVLDAMESIL